MKWNLAGLHKEAPQLPWNGSVMQASSALAWPPGPSTPKLAQIPLLSSTNLRLAHGPRKATADWKRKTKSHGVCSREAFCCLLINCATPAYDRSIRRHRTMWPGGVQSRLWRAPWKPESLEAKSLTEKNNTDQPSVGTVYKPIGWLGFVDDLVLSGCSRCLN